MASTRTWARVGPLLAAMLAAGCVATTAGSPSPPVSSPTLNPNQLARLSPPVTPLPSPSALVSASPPEPPAPSGSIAPATPRPLTELETLLPPGWSTRPLLPDDLAGAAEDPIYRGMLDRVGRSANDLEGATTECCNGIARILDLRIRGVAGDDLAAAWVASAAAAHPEMTSTTRTVDGVTVRRLHSTGSGAIEEQVVVVGDVVFVLGGSVDPTIAPGLAKALDGPIGWLVRPRLEQLLPDTIAGKPIQRFSLPASAIPTGGDICSYVCPGEIPALSKATRVPVERMDIGIAVAPDAPGAFVVAFRVPGASDRQLVEARAGLGEPFGRGTQKIGGKVVTWVAHDPFPNSSQNEYLYAKDHVLYSIRPMSDDGHPNASVVEAIGKLP
jgi:hypothetical protein